ncbi:MAG TPA: hypothetical protein VGM88_07005 [Kofleriaceae bacterium]|jgi:hypothetical protein
MRSQHLLDRVQSPQQAAELAEAPHAVADALAEELAPATTRDDLAARDAQLGAALAGIDALAERVARVRLEHALAHEPSIAAPTRRVFASTVIRYEHALDTLASRAHDVAERGGARDPSAVAAIVVDECTFALSLRRSVREGVVALIAKLAAASVAAADAAARDRKLDDVARKAWSALRRELEATAADPERVRAPIATRLASWPEQLDEPDPAAEPKLADLLELD